MKLPCFLNPIIPLLLFINNVESIRNLFLPRTGDISGISPSVITENLANVTNFEGLLGAGRSLAYPFAAGILLAITTLANENNWKVSDAGFSKVLGIPREEIVDSYGALLQMLETDENVTLSNTIFSFRSNFSPSEALAETLMTEIREASWTRETWKQTYQLMTEHLGNVTNEKIDTRLVPSVTKIGTPFRVTTEAVTLSTFHYINGWQYPWTGTEVGKFSENDGIPYLTVEGSFLVAEEDEFTAVSVPMEGGSKSIVFVLPHLNLTSKYFRKQAEVELGEDEPTDIVPFPKTWKLKKLRLRVPTFNTTDVDQYGQELEQIGVNETFCTIIRDYVGRYPYYLRPMVQVNFLDFNEDFLELASGTGVAVEKFRSLFTIIEGSGDKHKNNDDETTSTPSQNVHKSSNKTVSTSPQLTNVTSKASQDVENGTGSMPITGDSEMSNFVTTTYTSLLEDSTSFNGNDVQILSFDRPFLWYLNDSEVGPIFFGTVESLINLDLEENTTPPGGNDESPGTTMPPVTGDEMNGTDTSNGNGGNGTTESSSIMSELEKYFLWSCRSFIPASAAAVHQIHPSSFEKSFESDATKSVSNQFTRSSSEVAHNEKNPPRN